jgi:hypothetical protein
MKKRTVQNRTGNAGIVAILQYCQRNRLIFQAEPREDFGIDCYIELEYEELAQNFIIGIQSKAGPSYKKKITDQGFSVYLSKEDISYWLAANYPVFFVYYDIENDKLYFKHVQAEFHHYNDISKCNQFSFSESDSADNGELANYARELLQKTPNLLNRLEVTRTKFPVLMINDIACDLSSLVAKDQGLLELSSHFPETTRFPPEFPWWSGYKRVIGYSKDGRWICEFNTNDVDGPTHKRDTGITFLDTSSWASLSLPLLECNKCEKSGYVETTVCDCQVRLSKQVHRIQQVIQELNILPARQVCKVQNLYGVDRPNLDLALIFGRERFDLELAKHNGRDALLLNNKVYWPQRSIPIVIERVKPAPLFLSEEGSGEIEIFAVPLARRFECITEVALSNDGEWIAFSVTTNADHDCLGFPWTHLLHLRIRDVRDLCLKALAV